MDLSNLSPAALEFLQFAELPSGFSRPPKPRPKPEAQLLKSELPQNEDCKFSRIPWLERPHAIKFRQTEFYKEVLAPNLEGRSAVKRLFYSTLNEIFPRYLAPRYHAMDCKKLASCSPEKAVFWDNATHYLFYNQAFGPRLYHDLSFDQDILAKAAIKRAFVLFPVMEQIGNLQESELDECSTAKEFVLQPWVLVQLPFQPVLFYQWSVAVLAVALQFQKEVIEFYTQPHPHQYGPVIKRLLSINHKLLEFAQRSIEDFGELVKKSNEWLLKGNTDFIRRCKSVLPLLKFVLSFKGRETVKALKQLSYNSFRQKKDKLAEVREHPDFETFQGYFTRPCWENLDLEIWAKPEFRCQRHEVPEKTAKKPSSDDVEQLKKLIIEKIIKTGRLQGVPQEEMIRIINTMEMNSHLKGYYSTYLKYIGTCSENGSSKYRDGGIVLDIINLHSDVKVAEALNLLSQYCYCFIGISSPNVYITTLDCNGPVMTHKAVKEALEATDPTEKWSYNSILNRLKSSCSKPTEKFDRSWKPVDVVNHLEARIKFLVISAIEQQYLSLSKNYMYNVEQQFIQYVLPCMVSSILILEKDRSVSRSRLMDFIDLVYFTIRLYEREQFIISAPWNPSRSPYVTLKKNYASFHRLQDIDCQIILKDKYRTSPTVHTIVEVLFLRNQELIPAELPDEISRHLNCMLMQYYLMASRVRQSMDRLGWAKDVPTRIGNIAIFSYHKDIDPLAVEIHLIYLFHSASRSKLFMDQESLMFSIKRGLCQVDSKLCIDANPLTPEQLLGLVFYHASKYYVTKQKVPMKQKFDKMPFDELGDAIVSVCHHDWWKLKQIVAPFLKGDNFTDLSLIDLKTAKQNNCYTNALEQVTTEGKLIMRRPGEVTFFPIQHCRWCGMVAVDKFRLCPECRDDPEYPDIHFFCTENCETLCLDAQHIEEHARFEMVKLKISD